MPIEFDCPCGRKLKARDEAAGRNVKCPTCGAVLRVPTPEVSPEELATVLDGLDLSEGPEPAPPGALGNSPAMRPASTPSPPARTPSPAIPPPAPVPDAATVHPRRAPASDDEDSDPEPEPVGSEPPLPRARSMASPPPPVVILAVEPWCYGFLDAYTKICTGIAGVTFVVTLLMFMSSETSVNQYVSGAYVVAAFVGLVVTVFAASLVHLALDVARQIRAMRKLADQEAKARSA